MSGGNRKLVWQEVSSVGTDDRFQRIHHVSSDWIGAYLENDVEWVAAQCDSTSKRLRLFALMVEGMTQAGYAAPLQLPTRLNYAGAALPTR